MSPTTDAGSDPVNGASGETRATRIVVAEDEAIIRLDLVEILQAEGYEVVASTGRGDEALQLVFTHRPDVAVLDLKMPGLDGIELTKAIAAERQAAVVILTAFSQRDLVEGAREAGAMAYLVKPYERNDLVPAVELALARFREARALEGQVADLQDRLEVRKLVDRAKGRLIDEYKMSELDAYSYIQQTAMSQRCTMRAVSDDILTGRLRPGDEPRDELRGKPRDTPRDAHRDTNRPAN